MSIQTRKSKYFRNCLVIGLALVILLSPRLKDFAKPVPTHDPLSPSLQEYHHLFGYLNQAGFILPDVQELFCDPRVEYYRDIAISLYHPPRMEHYSSIYFHKAGETYEIDEFITRYAQQLKHAEERFGVNREAIVAVLFVETKIGKIVGNHSVFNVLSSLSLADSPPSLRQIENHINERYHYLDYDKRQELIQYYQNRAERKAVWARAEFASLLRLHFDSHLDILELPGSYAGAFGYPQFMPSNVQRYGVDGDNDGIIDLYNFSDAIMSVGNFLSKKGWTEDTERQYRALLRYNNSHSYVENVLETASSILAENDFID
ncbi:MAG TPA: lytic murein transglycosylase [Candidatus Marinimicrobia bacterium]|nr:lytic murein transglycosylase [Candidatus Neomarinimicrobiota bacterium]